MEAAFCCVSSRWPRAKLLPGNEKQKKEAQPPFFIVSNSVQDWHQTLRCRLPIGPFLAHPPLAETVVADYEAAYLIA